MKRPRSYDGLYSQSNAETGGLENSMMAQSMLLLRYF
jgi:hypothetical protein